MESNNKLFDNKLTKLSEEGEDDLPSDTVDETDNGSPIAEMLYSFLTSPDSSRYAWYWSIMMNILVLIRITAIGLESCDGPNQYHNRIDRSRYKFLLSYEQYFELYIVCMVPLIIDAFCRVAMVSLLFLEENRPICKRFLRDKLQAFLFFADIISVIPFFIDATYTRPSKKTLTQFERIILRLIELMITGRILRSIKKFPAVRTITITLFNSYEHLILPIFFFFVFNITSGVFFYFAEPCYNIDECGWINLFESTFYSIVTMTSTGYGNQVPKFELARFVACCVMLFGTLFLSMPLAIIGNEYDRNWHAIMEEQQIRINEENNERSLILPSFSLSKTFSMKKEDPNKLINEHKTPSESSSNSSNSSDHGDDLSQDISLDEDKSSSSRSSSRLGSGFLFNSNANNINNPTNTSNTTNNSTYNTNNTMSEPRRISQLSFQDRKSIAQASSIYITYTNTCKLTSDLSDTLSTISCQQLMISFPSLCQIKANLTALALHFSEMAILFKFIPRVSSAIPDALHPSIANLKQPIGPRSGQKRLSIFGGRSALTTSNTLSNTHSHQNNTPTPAHIITSTPSFTKSNVVVPYPLVENEQVRPPPMKQDTTNIDHNVVIPRISNRREVIKPSFSTTTNNSQSQAQSVIQRREMMISNTQSPPIAPNLLEKYQKLSQKLQSMDGDEDSSLSDDLSLKSEEDPEHYSMDSYSLDETEETDSTSNQNPSLNIRTHDQINKPIQTIERYQQQQLQQQQITTVEKPKVTFQISEELIEKTNQSIHNSNLPVTTNNTTNNNEENNKETVVRNKVSFERTPSKVSDYSSDDQTPNNRPISLINVRKKRASSLYTRFLHAIGKTTSSNSLNNDINNNEQQQTKARLIRQHTQTFEFMRRIEEVVEKPSSYRNQLWVLLELPESSAKARAIQLLIIFLVVLSVFILYTQTIVELTHYGESTNICEKLLTYYCSDKSNPNLDPGCYQANNPLKKLDFHCDESTCFGHGNNFGARSTNLTCSNANTLPFQDMTQLLYNYGSPTLFTTRQEMHRLSPICDRIECTDNSKDYYNANPAWIGLEFTINLIFTVELALRIFVAKSLRAFVGDSMNVFDLLAVLPFYTEVFNALKNKEALNFSILASSPEPIFFVMMRSLKVFRMFKLTRHFRASKVLFNTARTIWKQILGMLCFLAFLITVISIVLYELERGKACYVGDAGCHVPEDALPIYHTGDLIYINKDGSISQFSNVFFGVWFSFVSCTTTGYGDIVPVTNGGQVMAIFLMLLGMFYMAMPLTAATSTFYSYHEKFNDLQRYDNDPTVPGDDHSEDDDDDDEEEEEEDDDHHMLSDQTTTIESSALKPSDMLKQRTFIPSHKSSVDYIFIHKIQQCTSLWYEYDQQITEQLTQLPLKFYTSLQDSDVIVLHKCIRSLSDHLIQQENTMIELVSQAQYTNTTSNPMTMTTNPSNNMNNNINKMVQFK